MPRAILAAWSWESSRCMSRRAGGAAAALALAAIAVAATAPAPAMGHAIGGTYTLPVPLALYLGAAAAAVAASFIVTSWMAREDPGFPRYRTATISRGVGQAARTALRPLGLVWWYGAIVVGLVIGDVSPLPGVLLWVGIWVGLPIVAVLVGNPWPSLSPFRTTYAGLSWASPHLRARAGPGRVPYPSPLARWPAVALLACGVWAELILPGGSTAGTVAWIMVGYTILTLGGMALFGQVPWLRNAELFEVLLGWFGRIGPIGRHSQDDALCDACGEACDPRRCIDCPECAVAADDGERRSVLRPWVVGLRDVRRAGWSDAAFIVLALAGVSFDGLRETAFGAGLVGAVQPTVIGALGPTALAFLLADTIVFAVVAAAFGAAFLAVVTATHGLADPARRASLGGTAGVHAATLLPIAGGYLVAHYLTLVVQGAVWLPTLLADPLMGLAPQLDWIPTALVWYVSVGAIVGGHIAGIVLAHAIALREAPGRAVRAGLPIVALMIGYTVLSLWIIAQPIVVEPDTVPPAAHATVRGRP